LLVKRFYSMLQLNVHCSFLFDLLPHDLSSLHDHLPSSHVLLHEPKALVFLMKAHWLVLDDGFDFILRVLMLILFSFGFLVWLLVVLLLLLRR
jgi:hypothetical protein